MISIQPNDLTQPVQRPDFFKELDNRLEQLLLKVFRFIDFESLLNTCQTSKHLYTVLTNVHRNISEDDASLCEHQCNRMLIIRHRQLYGNKPPNFFDYLIPENATAKHLNTSFSSCRATENFDLINIIFRKVNSEEIHINLSEQCKKTIAAVCTNRRPDWYNCADFAMECMNKYDANAPNDLQICYEHKVCNELTLVSGNIIVLFGKKEFKHIAIYATNGIYLSKYGTIPGIRASTLKQMMEAYEADCAYKLREF